MASPVPVKSQPLHNFNLPHLKWTKNLTNNNHRGRSRLSSPQQSPMRDSAPRLSPMRSLPMRESAARLSPMHDSVPRRSPMRDSASESESFYDVRLRNGVGVGPGSDSIKNWAPDVVKSSFILANPDLMTDKAAKRLTAADLDLAGGKEVRSKIFIRLRKNKADDVNYEEKADDVNDEERADHAQEEKIGIADTEVEESVPKTWNLRPRKPLGKPQNVNCGTSKVENKVQLPLLTHNRPESEQTTAEKEKKQKFSISLSREEIEEDIYALTGSKPARRPKKRNRTVQKSLDNLFPGMWLALISPDSYKVSENPPKA